MNRKNDSLNKKFPNLGSARQVEVHAMDVVVSQSRGGRTQKGLMLRTALLSLALALAAVVALSSTDLPNVRLSLEEKLQRLSQRKTGHYAEKGNIHYFSMAAPASPSDASSETADQGEYRTASASGLGLAGGGDPFKYIRTGHYAKILHHESQVVEGWQNGTTVNRIALKSEGKMQQLADATALASSSGGIKSRDEALLSLLSAPVSQAELNRATLSKGKMTKDTIVHNLNRFNCPFVFMFDVVMFLQRAHVWMLFLQECTEPKTSPTLRACMLLLRQVHQDTS